MAETRLSAWRLSAFSGPAVPIAALGLPIGVYLPQFYAGPMGLGLATVGTIFMLARFWDVITDPVMGIVSDRFPSRWGRRRHWLVLSVPITALAAWFVFMPSAPVTAGYLLFWMFVLYVGWTMLTISHMAWAAELSDDYNERSRVQAFREGFQILGVPLVLTLPAIIESMGVGHMETARVEAMGWFIIVLLPVTVLINLRFVGERPAAPQPVISLREGIAPLLKNHALQRLVVADFVSGFSAAALGSMFIYEVTHVWQLGSWASLLLLFYFFAGLGFIPLVLRLSYRFGKHYTLVGTALFNAIFAPALFLIPPGNVWIAGMVLLFLGVNVGSATILYRSIMADVADLDELHTGQRRTGLFYSLLTLTQKIGGAVAVGIVFWTLAYIGFNPRGENTEAAVGGLSMVFVGVPVICNLLVALIMWRFPIGLKEQEDLRRRLEERVVEELEAVERSPLS